MDKSKPPTSLQKLVRGIVRQVIELNRLPKSKKKSYKPNKPHYVRGITRLKVFRRDGHRCCYCGRTSKEVPLEVDHIIPVARGGSSEMSNLQTLCRDCNRSKGVRPL